MAESDKDTKPGVVVGTPKKGSKKTRLLVLVIVVLVVAGGAAGAALYLKHQHDKEFIKVDGQIYKVNLVPQSNLVQSSAPTTDQLNKQIQDAETTAKQDPTYRNYRNLAQLYVTAKEKQKAIDNYQQAILLVPKDQYYQAIVDDLNQRISSAEANL